MNPPMPDDLLAITRELIALRKKPTTQERFKRYPTLLKRFEDLVAVCEDVATLQQVIELDSGYHLLAGYRQRVLERWLKLQHSAQVLRLYAMQLELFGDVDEWGEANTDVAAKITALEAEALALES